MHTRMAVASLKRQLSVFELKNVHGLDNPNKKVGGEGSYGAVYEVTVDGVPRFAKQLHSVLITSDIQPDQKQGIFERFYNECLLLSKLKHSHIVEFIGVHFGSSQKEFDVSLIMEKLHTDLAKYLGQHPNIPLNQKLSVLLDVSTGLLYLHSQQIPIIHRDLTTGNILLTKGLRAKIADFGVSRALNISPNRLATQTKCPGTLAYMPPEALQENPVYGKALDVFSFGQVCLCTLHQVFAEVFDVSNKRADMSRALQNGELEILKRKKWFDMIPDGHCLRDLIVNCLQDESEKRPSTEQLKEKLTLLCLENWRDETVFEQDFEEERQARAEAVGARNSDYGKFSHQVESLTEQLEQAKSEKDVERKAKQAVISKLEENIATSQTLKRQLEQAERDFNQAIEAKSEELKNEKTDNTQLKGSVAKLQEQLQRAETTYLQRQDELLQQLEEFEHEAKHREGELQEKVQMVTAQKLSLNEQLEKVTEELKAKEKQLETTAAEKQVIEERLESKTDHNVALTQELSETKANGDRFTIELQEARERLDSAHADLARLHDDVLAKTAQVKQYKKQTDSFKLKVEEANDRLLKTQSELQRCQKLIKTMEEDQQDQIKQARLNAETEKFTAENKLAQAQRRIDALERQVYDLTSEGGQGSEALRVEIERKREIEQKLDVNQVKYYEELMDKCDSRYQAMEKLKNLLTQHGIALPNLEIDKDTRAQDPNYHHQFGPQQSNYHSDPNFQRNQYYPDSGQGYRRFQQNQGYSPGQRPLHQKGAGSNQVANTPTTLAPVFGTNLPPPQHSQTQGRPPIPTPRKSSNNPQNSSQVPSTNRPKQDSGVQENALLEGIDHDIKEAANYVIQEPSQAQGGPQPPTPIPRKSSITSSPYQNSSRVPSTNRPKQDSGVQKNALLEVEATSYVIQEGEVLESMTFEAPFDPNLICPLCMRNFRVGEIQKYKKHANSCQGQI